MRKKRLIATAFLLLALSIIGKILSTLVKILLARLLTKEAMTLYALASPTMLFFITLAQLGLPNTVSKIIADSKIRKKGPIAATLIIATINNILLVLLLLLFIPLLARLLFKNDTSIQNVLYAITPLLPLVTISGVLKGYYSGKQKHLSASGAAIVEEVVRLLFILVVLLIYPTTDGPTLAAIAMLSISVGEIGTIFFLCLLLPKLPTSFNQLLSQSNSKAITYVLSLAIPLSGSRFIGTLTLFLEPLLISLLASSSLLTIQESYGELHGYILPLLSLSSFISATLSSYLLPTFTAQYSKGNIQHSKQLLLQVSLLSLGVSLLFASLLFLLPQQLCILLYHKELSPSSIQAIRFLAFPFAIGSLQSIFSVCLTAINQTHLSFLDSVCGSSLRLLSLILLLPLLHENTLFLSLLIGFLTTTILHGIRLYRALFQHHM